MRKAIQKAIQSHLLSFLAHRWALPFLLVLLFLTLNSVLLLLATLLRPQGGGVDFGKGNLTVKSKFEEGSSTFTHVLSSRYDNIGNQNFEEKLCYGDIDIVYTWVNGSDPRQIEALQAVKDKELQQQNLTHLRRCNSSENPSDHGCWKDDATANRYVDNEELRYSLRSVEKFAPWIRQIFIVTNGQIPSWLNLQRPRLHLITHEQIYKNKSHLPTFSSPSIETQLHNIPGLSRHWIYLNDDVMFGNHIWPSDFYTQSGGNKIFLSWPVPNCADNCPSNWIGDGYCDISCNTSECDYDGGDCRNSTNTGSNWWWGSSNSGSKDTFDQYCAKGCPDSWVGDKYCDRSCKHEDCAMDGGDCGVLLVYQTTYGINLTTSDQKIEKITLPPGTLAAYFNLSHVIPLKDEIISAVHDNNKMIRTATILQKEKLLIMTLHRILNQSVVNVTFEIEYEEESTGSVTSSGTTPDGNGTTPTPTTPIGASPTLKSGTTSKNQKNTPPTSVGNPVSTITPDGKIKRNLTFQIFLDTGAKNGTNGTNPSENDTSTLKRTFSEDNGVQMDNTGRKLMESNAPEINQPSPSQNVTPGPEKISPISPGSPSRTYNIPYSAGSHHSGSGKMSTYSSPSPPVNTKKHLDNYGESLKFVNKLMTAKFGAEGRRVPSHMPHFLDTEIIRKLQETWPNEFDATSSHQLRSPKDMQFAFAYFYFLMNQRVPYDFDEVFDTILDTDRDGELNPNELRTLIMVLHGGAMEQNDHLIFRENFFVNCSNKNETQKNPQPQPQTPPTNTSVPSNTSEPTKSEPTKSEPTKSELDTSPSTSSSTLPTSLENVTTKGLKRSISVKNKKIPEKTAEDPDKAAEKEGKTAEKKDKTAENKDKTTEKRDKTAEDKDKTTEKRDKTTENKDKTAENKDKTTEKRDKTTENKDKTAEETDKTAKNKDKTTEKRDKTTENKDKTAENKDKTAEDTDKTTKKNKKISDKTAEDPDNTAEDTDNTAEDTDNTAEDTDKTVEEVGDSSDDDSVSVPDVEPDLLGSNKSEPSPEPQPEYLPGPHTKPETHPRFTPDDKLPRITKEYLKTCDNARKKIELFYGKIRKNKFEMGDTDQVAFVMVPTNSTDVQRSLDGIRQKKQKFICLNDNMNHSNPHSREVVRVIQEFYKSIVPLPSSFELPANKTNRYLYVEDFMKAREDIQKRKRTIYILIVVLGVCFLCLVKSCVYDHGFSRLPNRPRTNDGPRQKRFLRLLQL